MNKVVSFCILICFLTGCSSKKEVVVAEVIPPPPTWVHARPMSPAYYIGIGSASKSMGTHYLRTAKENALSDLASEIKVNVNANSLLYSLEKNGSFEQEFKESIQTSTNLNIESFEIVDNYEDATHYYTYYRLDKGVYAENQRKKKAAAQLKAIGFYDNAEAAVSEGNYAVAVQSYLQGLQALEEFWNEDNTVEHSTGSLMIDNAIYTQLNALITSLEIKAEKKIERNYSNGFSPTAAIIVSLKGKGFSNVPLYYKYVQSDSKYGGKITSGQNGKCEISMTDTPSNIPLTLDIKVDVEPLFSPFERDPFMRDLLNSFKGATAELPVGYKNASAWIKGSEKNLDASMNPTILTAALKSGLAEKGVLFVDSPSRADVKITLEANTKAGSESQGFASTYLNYSIEIRDRITGASKFSVSESNVKGVDMNFEKAGTKAYNNLKRNIEREIISKLKTQIY